MAAYLSVISFRRIIPLLISLALTSAIIFFTSASFNGIYQTAIELMGGEEDISIIYSAGAKSPQTSIIPLSLYDEIRSIEGVTEVSPEVVAVVLVKDHAAVVRGVDPNSFKSICGIKIITGTFELNNSWFAIVGRNLAKLLNINVGDTLILRSAYNDNFLEVRVTGIFESRSSLDDELIIPIYAAQWLRGLQRDAISLLRVRIEENELSKEDLLGYLRGEKKVERKHSTEQSSIIRLLTIPEAREYAGEYVAKSPRESMKDFLENIVRINEVVIWGVVVVVFAGCILLIYLINSIILTSHYRELTILNGLGAPKRKLTLSLIAFTITISALSAVLGFILGSALSKVFSESGLLLLGSYIARPSLNAEIIIIVGIGIVIISAISVWLSLNKVLKDKIWEV